MIEIRDMQRCDLEYAGPCTHCGESDELTASGTRRTAWFRDRWGQGARVKVALLDGEQAGILHMMPVEISPWGSGRSGFNGYHLPGGRSGKGRWAGACGGGDRGDASARQGRRGYRSCAERVTRMARAAGATAYACGRAGFTLGHTNRRCIQQTARVSPIPTHKRFQTPYLVMPRVRGR